MQVPVPLVMVMVAEPAPLPEQTPEVVIATERLEEAVAATPKVDLKAALAGALVVTVISWEAWFTFCVKFPDISNSMVERKTADIIASGADTLLAGDLGCLMNIAGKLQRQGSAIKVRHVAEVLAGMGDEPAIGEAK